MAHRSLITDVFDFDDVMLVPGKCIVSSRSAIHIETILGARAFKLPVIPANMASIIDEKLATYLASHEYFYVMHRFDVDPLAFTKSMHEKGLYSSISVGVQPKDFKDIELMVEAGEVPEYITVDIAHGHADSVIEIVKHIKEYMPTTYVIAGNVGTVEGTRALAKAGADAAKVGIGPGCFAPGQKVVTAAGLKNIEDIIEGDRVLTHKGRYQKVVNLFEFDHHEETITVNGITCTPDHEFYVCLKEDISKITEENYQDFCFWLEAHRLDPTLHQTVKIEK